MASPVRSVPGTVVYGETGFDVNVDGSPLEALWTYPYVPKHGDNVRVLIADGRAVILGAVSDVPRIDIGTAQSSGSGRVNVALDGGGGVVSCRYTGSPPNAGTRVRVDWASTEPWVWPGAVATVPEEILAGIVVPEAPPEVRSYRTNMQAIASGTYRPEWNRWEPGNVRQGSYSSYDYRGAWFYGGQGAAIAGGTIDAIHIHLGGRLRLGNYNSALAIRLHMATAVTGNWGALTGAHEVSLPPGWGGGAVQIPTAWAGHIANGAGVGITGGSYLGVNGIDADPASGQLIIDWRK